jgi:hypothetical protein
MKIFERLLYLDRDFISASYEVEKGYSPETKITKTEGLNAGMRIPLFSAGASSVESKAYSVSTFGMLSELENQLSNYPEFLDSDHKFGKSSLICWVNGNLTIEKVEVKRRKYTITFLGKPSKPGDDDKERLVAEEFYFSIHSDGDSFALIPTPDYFVSGVSSFQELVGTVIGPIEMPVKALIRVYSAQTSFKQWIAVPMVILEP